MAFDFLTCWSVWSYPGLLSTFRLLLWFSGSYFVKSAFGMILSQTKYWHLSQLKGNYIWPDVAAVYTTCVLFHVQTECSNVSLSSYFPRGSKFPGSGHHDRDFLRVSCQGILVFCYITKTQLPWNLTRPDTHTPMEVLMQVWVGTSRNKPAAYYHCFHNTWSAHLMKFQTGKAINRNLGGQADTGFAVKQLWIQEMCVFRNKAAHAQFHHYPTHLTVRATVFCEWTFIVQINFNPQFNWDCHKNKRNDPTCICNQAFIVLWALSDSGFTIVSYLDTFIVRCHSCDVS